MADSKTETSPTPEAREAGPPEASATGMERPPGPWERRYAELVAYKAEHGNCDVPYKWTENGGLSRWVLLQRVEQFGRRMKPEREARLEALGFQWQEKGHMEVWEEYFQRLIDYQKEHGHQGVMRAEDPRLWSWIYQQRYKHNVGRMKPRRRERLESIGFLWKAVKAREMDLVPDLEQRWDTMCGLLEKHIVQEGPGSIGELSPQSGSLGHWLWNQRRKARRGELPPECRARLEAAGALADLDRVDLPPNWQARCTDLRAFFQEHGHTRAAAPMKDYLRKWCRELRVARKLGELEPEHIAMLDALNFDWEIVRPRRPENSEQAEEVWNRQYEKLRSFHQEHGHSNVPYLYQGNPSLYRWAGVQRTRHINGLLSPEQEARLAELNFRTERQRPENYDAWEVHYAGLMAYHEKHGHTQVKSQDDPSLSYWRYQQWQARDAGTLSAEKIARLDALDFVWAPASSTRPKMGRPLSSVEERRWNRYYQKLRAYHRQHGHSQVPLNEPDHGKLAEWVFNQRYKLRKGHLSAAQVAMLAELGFE